MRTRFHHSMVDLLRDYLVAGLEGNDDIARILSEHYSFDVTAGDVARWRREHRRFGMVCVNAIDNLHAVAVGVIAQAIKDGSTAEAKWLLERTNPKFKPTSKLEHGGKVAGLAEMLAGRVTDEQLADDGVLIYDD